MENEFKGFKDKVDFYGYEITKNCDYGILDDEDYLDPLSLSGANMQDVDASKSNFSGGIISQANFTNSNLAGSDLKEVNVHKTNFSGANLTSIDFTGAKFDKYTNLEGAVLIDTKGIPNDVDRSKSINTVEELYKAIDSIDEETPDKEIRKLKTAELSNFVQSSPESYARYDEMHSFYDYKKEEPKKPKKIDVATEELTETKWVDKVSKRSISSQTLKSTSSEQSVNSTLSDEERSFSSDNAVCKGR